MMPLIAYDRAGSVLAALHELYWTAPDGSVHAVDLDAAEAAGPLTDLWIVSGARGSCLWPEHLGERFVEFRVERESGRAVRLVHRRSGHVRHRGLVDDALAAVEETQHRPLLAARRRILGDAGHPLRLDAHGRPWPDADRDAPPPPLLAHRLQADPDRDDAGVPLDMDDVTPLLDGDEPTDEHEQHDDEEHAAEEAGAGEVRVAHRSG